MIWLSGTRGFIGSYLIRSLLSTGYEVRCVSNSKTENSQIIHIDFSEGDRIAEAIHKYGIPDTFIHLGWGNVYEPQSDVHLTSNVQDGKNLISELFDHGLEKFVFLGSSSEYGSLTGILSEDMKPLPKITNYAKGKTEVCSFGTKLAGRLNKVFIHIRLFYTLGVGQRSSSLINQLYDCYLDKSIMNLSPCEHYRDYIYISDVVKGITLLEKVNESGIVNLGSGSAIRLRNYVTLFWNYLGGDPKQLKFGEHLKPENEPEQPFCYADLTRLRRLTGWIPSISIEDGIKRTISKMRDYQ